MSFAGISLAEFNCANIPAKNPAKNPTTLEVVKESEEKENPLSVPQSLFWRL